MKYRGIRKIWSVILCVSMGCMLPHTATALTVPLNTTDISAAYDDASFELYAEHAYQEYRSRLQKQDRRTFIKVMAYAVVGGAIIGTGGGFLVRKFLSSHGDFLQPIDELMPDEQHLVKAIDRRHQTVGSYVNSICRKESALSGSFLWREFVRYLDESDWLRAACLFRSARFATLRAQLVDGHERSWYGVHVLCDKLDRLYKKDHDPYQLRSFDKGRYLVFTDEYGLFVHDGGERVFGELNLLNMVYAHRDVFPSGMRLSVIQGHNGAYFCWKEAQRRGVLPVGSHKKKRTILYHFDNHQDFAASAPLDAGIYNRGDTEQKRNARDADRLRISNYIAPALVDKTVDEIVWVVPDEIYDNQRLTYAPRPGTYELWVGYLVVADGGKRTVCFSPEPDFSVYGGTLQGKELWRDGKVQGKRKIKVHIVSSSDTKALYAYSRPFGQVLLSVDEDFFGAEPYFNRKRKYTVPSDTRFETLLTDFKRFMESGITGKVRDISIARSPNYTYREVERHITQRVRRIIIAAMNRGIPGKENSDPAVYAAA